MSKLEEFRKTLDDVRKRGDNFLEHMEQQNNNFFHPSGAWARLTEALAMLGERIQRLNAPNAALPSAANDQDVQKLLHEYVEAKNQCRRYSEEFWTTVTRVQAVAIEVKTLQGQVDTVISQKKATSKTVGGLAALSKDLTVYRNELKTACITGPHRITHALLS